jgi:nucleotide-binding universal stress UspA family protein
VDPQQNPHLAELSRLLVAADPGIDPHRLVRVCCQHAGDEPPSVSLLIPVEDESRPWSESTAEAERLLHDADVLLGAAGVHLEDVVITDGDGPDLGELVRFGGFDAMLICAVDASTSSAVLSRAARLARAHGLEVIDSRGAPDRPGWLRRFVGPLFHWQRVRERAT